MIKMNRILAPNMLWICIDRCDAQEITGKIYSIMRKEFIPFQNFHQMILHADALFDEIAFPQAFEEKRTFKEKQEIIAYSNRKKTPVLDSADILFHKGQLCTCLIAVETRQHANWQGKVLSTDFTLTNTFCDVVDLLNVIMKIIENA